MKRFPPHTIALAAIALVVALWFFTRRDSGHAPAAFTEAAVRERSGSALFFNRSARDLVEKAAPGAIKQAGAGIARFEAAVADPKVFRQLDRKMRFDTVLLAGDPAWSAALSSHLSGSRDWALDYVDPSVILFRRPASSPWTPAQLEEVHRQLAPLDNKTRAAALAAIASRLQALGKTEAALRETEKALAADSRSAAGWDQLARYYSQFGNWKKALEAANRALDAEPDFASALMTKASILAASDRMYEAYPVSRRLQEIAPEDPYVLFLHARIAHGVRAYGEETRVLTKLITTVEKAGRSSSAYWIYLGQAHAAAGNAEPALEAFQKALEAGDLPPEQQAFAREAIERLLPQVAR